MIYFLQASICLLVLYIFYLFIRKDHFFNFQRIYLIAALALSVLIPLVEIDLEMTTDVVIEDVIWLADIDNSFAQAGQNYVLRDILLIVYLTGVFVILIRLAFSIVKIARIINMGKIVKRNDVAIIYSDLDLKVSSFYKYIFISKKHNYTDQELNSIMIHEGKHLHDNHTLDLMIIELYKVVFWFNPVIYMINKEIRSIHEFISDREVIKFTSKESYEQLLIKTLFEDVKVPLISHFNQVSIKNRINMMNLEKSANRNKLKFALTIPLIISMITLNNCNNPNPEITKGEFVISGKVVNLDGDPLPGVNISIKGTPNGTVTNIKGGYELAATKADKSLVYAFLGFKAKEITINEREKIDLTLEQGTNYISQGEVANHVFTKVKQQAEFEGGIEKFYDYVMTNLKYPAQAKRLGIEGKVFVEFVVERDGSITNVKALRGIGAGCDAEALKVIKESPNWNPGVQMGKEVRVRRVIPITFRL